MEREKLIRLVTAAQQGDGDALNNLFNEFYNDVYYFALKTVKDEDLACDITQESFVEIINTIGDLQEPAAFIKWMKQITYHQCTRYFKKKKDVLVDEDEEGNTVFDIVAEDRTEFIPDEALDQQDFRKTILAMLDDLSEEQRAATLLYYYDELSVKQIAEIQGVSEGTVKSRLNYARKSIKNSVETYEKKNNVKLHSFAFLPFMLWLLRAGAQDSAALAAGAAPAVAAGVSAATGTTIAAAAASGTAAAVAAGTTAVAGTGLVAKIAALPLAVKIISVLTAGAIVVGSVGIAISNQQEDPTEPSATVQLPSSSAPTIPTDPSLPTGPTVPPTFDPPKPTEPSAPVAPHVHTYGETVVDATCTEQGYTIFICDCGDSYEDNYVAAQGHSWDTGVITQEPTEDAGGERLYHCLICNDTRIELIPELGHTHRYAEVITDPSCTEQGYTTYTCACSDSYVSNYTAAIGHDYVSQVIAPTTESQGYTKHECRNCGHSYEDNFVDQLPTEEDPDVYYVPEDSTYIMADGTELAAGEAMPEMVMYGDQLITPHYTYTCIGDGYGWRAAVNDTTLDKYPELLSEINGVPLLSLNETFMDCANITQAPQIPNSVMSMYGTFWNCSSLVEAPEIPNGVVDMSYTFYDCSSLVEAPVIPNSVTSMYGTFDCCSSLVVAPEIPNSVTNMSSTFMGCSSLVAAPVIPNGVTDMSYTFYGCSSLVEAPEIPNGVTNMCGTFAICTSLVKAPEIPNGVTDMNYTFAYCNSLVEVPVIPNSVTNMSETFRNCTNLVEAPVIPNSVTNMYNTFTYCYSLTGSIEIHANLEDEMQAIDGCFAYTNLPIVLTGTSTNLNELAATATNGNVTVASSDDTSAVYYVPEGCTYILADGTKLIAGEAMPESISIGDEFITADYIYKYGYEIDRDPYGYWGDEPPTDPNVEWIQSMYDGWGVTIIDNTKEFYSELLDHINGKPLLSMRHTFYGCTQLVTAPVIPTNVKNVHGTFEQCYSLTGVADLPEVTSLQNTFRDCYSLVMAPTIPNTVTDLSYTFYNCSSMINAPAIPAGVYTMDSTFVGCSSICIAPHIPNSVAIMNFTFRDCTALTTAPTIPESVTSMDYIFAGCHALTGSIVIHARELTVLQCNGTCMMCNLEQHECSDCFECSDWAGCFNGTVLPIILTGTSTRLNELAATATNGNVTVAFEE